MVQGHPPRPRHRTGLLVNLGLFFASLVLSLLAAEAAVRLLSPVGPALLVTDPGVGKRYVPGFQGRVFVDEAGREVEVRINSAGFRGPEWARRKAPGGLRVAVVGDSMTAGIATDEERTFARRLESGLAAQWPGRPVEVMNFGVSSASTGAALVTWREAVAGYAPDLVLLAFFNGNDLGDNCSRLTRAPRVYFELDGEGRLVPGQPPAPTPALARWLDLHSRLYVWQKVATRQLRAATRRPRAGSSPARGSSRATAAPTSSTRGDLTGALLRALRDEVEASGARFGLVVVPCAEQVDDALWADLRRQAGGGARPGSGGAVATPRGDRRAGRNPDGRSHAPLRRGGAAARAEVPRRPRASTCSAASTSATRATAWPPRPSSASSPRARGGGSSSRAEAAGGITRLGGRP